MAILICTRHLAAAIRSPGPHQILVQILGNTYKSGRNGYSYMYEEPGAVIKHLAFTKH